MIEAGNLYLATPPLFKVTAGKSIHYAYSDREKDDITGKLKNQNKSVEIQRYKGLGEQNPQELWETTMDPATRILKQVTVADAEEADRLFDVLMGGDVAPRKKWIQTHAKAVVNLDV